MKRIEFTNSQREYWVNFLLARDGYRCTCCPKDVVTLIRESKPDRKLPVLVIDHIDGDTRFTDGKDGVHGSNLRLACYSCNRKNTKSTRPTMPKRDMTPEHEKSAKSKPKFYDWLNAYLIENKNICYQRMLNRGSDIANESSQISAKRWFNQRVDSFVDGSKKGYEVFDAESFGVTDCDYSLCDGDHVCFYGEVPRKEDVAREKALAEGTPNYDDPKRFT